jgi:hypothetical protein
MKIEIWQITRVKPYEQNPRLNDDAVDAVAASIREFGLPPGCGVVSPRIGGSAGNPLMPQHEMAMATSVRSRIAVIMISPARRNSAERLSPVAVRPGHLTAMWPIRPPLTQSTRHQ